MRTAILLLSLGFVACGGSSGTPTEAPINLTASGVSSAAISIPSGGRVHFFNKDTVNHQITSSDCPVLSTRLLTPGSDDLRPQMTGPLFCTYGDVSGAAAFNGKVNVSAPGAAGGGGGSGY